MTKNYKYKEVVKEIPYIDTVTCNYCKCLIPNLKMVYEVLLCKHYYDDTQTCELDICPNCINDLFYDYINNIDNDKNNNSGSFNEIEIEYTKCLYK